MFIYSHAFTQVHKATLPNCVYYKEPPRSEHGARVKVEDACPVCQKKANDERLAKLEEDRKRTEARIAKEKEESLAREKKLKEENERKERAERERLAFEAAAKKRKEENNLRFSKERDASIKRMSEIQNRYKEFANIKGQESEEYIEDLVAFSDKEFYGVKYKGDVLWRVKSEYPAWWLYRLMKTNYFILKVGSKHKIIDMYGNAQLVDGDEWFDDISFDQDKNVIKFKLYLEAFYQASDRELKETSHEVDFYMSKDELLSVHNQLYTESENLTRKRKEKERLEREEYNRTNRDDNLPYRKVTLVMSRWARQIHIARGEYIVTDIKLKTLDRKVGYFLRTEPGERID